MDTCSTDDLKFKFVNADEFRSLLKHCSLNPIMLGHIIFRFSVLRPKAGMIRPWRLAFAESILALAFFPEKPLDTYPASRRNYAVISPELFNDEIGSSRRQCIAASVHTRYFCERLDAFNRPRKLGRGMAW